MPTVLANQMVKFEIRVFDSEMEPVKLQFGVPRHGAFFPDSTLRDKAERLLAVVFSVTPPRHFPASWYGFAEVVFEICEPCSNVVADTKVYAFEVLDVTPHCWEREFRSI